VVIEPEALEPEALIRQENIVGDEVKGEFSW